MSKRQGSLKRQILGFSVVSILIMALIFIFISIYSIVSGNENRLERYRNELLANKKQELKHYTQIALISIANQSPEASIETLRSLSYGNNDYFWINDLNHVMISHPDPNLMGKDLSDLKDVNGVYFLRELVKVAKEKREGYAAYAWKKLGEEKPSPKLSYVKEIPGSDWMLGTGVYIDDIDAMMIKERNQTRAEIASLIIKNIIAAILITVIISLIYVYFFNQNLNKPMAGIVKTLQGFNNDLTLRVRGNFKHEFNQLASSFNGLIEELHQIISKLAHVSVKVNSYVNDISAAVEEQAAVTSEQSASVTEITSTMEEFSATSTQIAEHANSVSQIASKTLEGTKKGAIAAEQFWSKMEEIHQGNQNSLKEIVELGRKSKEITKVMEIINNIADQTKLIAFNAALEASSAGESGKRFGVVAAEIRRLADNVMESTGEIESRGHEIQEAINHLVIASEKESKAIREGMEYSKNTADLLISIVGGAESTSGAAKQISLSTQQQKTASDPVVTALREIDEGARQTSEAISHISLISRDLSVLSDNLKDLVGKFRTA